MIVVWQVSERCNLGCPFCAFDRGLRRSRREAGAAEVTHLGAVLAAYRRATGDRVLFSLLGGEPLRWAPWRPVSAHLAELGLAVSATTNGTTLADPAVRAHLVRHFAELTVSVDAFGETHDRLRGWRGGFAALRRDLAALADERDRRGSRSRLRLRVNVVLMRDTVAGFADLCLGLAELGVDEVTFNALGGRDRPEFWAQQRLLPAQIDDFARALPALRTRLAATGVTLGGSPAYLERLRHSAEGGAWPVVDCRPGETFLFVDVAGRVAPCHFTADALGVPVASLTDVAALAALPPRWRTDLAGGLPPCHDCHATHVFGKFPNAAPRPTPRTPDATPRRDARRVPG